MTRFISVKILCLALLDLVCLTQIGVAQNPAGACGGQQFCVETNDFVVTITNFRTSMTTSNVKVIDTTLRFQNKTNQPLILGYVVTSGMATDDRGNRLVVGGPNGFRGIGYVNGANFEPKFRLAPGGYADAQFELLAQGWPKLVGFTHQFDLTVDEINSYEGNQHTIGGEFPLHFQGLTNGSAGSTPVLGALASPGAAAAGPCGLAGAQGVAGKASATVSNAANTLSSLGSIFGRKKTAQNANQVASAAAGCDPRVNGVASTAGSVAGMASAANAQQNPQAAAANAQLQQQMMAAANNAAAQQAAAAANYQQVSATQQTTADANAQAAAAALGGTGATPLNVATDAYSRTKQAQLRRQQQRGARAGQQTATQQGAPQQIASAAPPAGSATTSAEPWTPPADTPAASSRTVPATLDPAKMPDIIGVHLGMDAREAMAVVKAHYPKNFLTSYTNTMSVFPQPVFQGLIVNPSELAQDDFNFQVTLPPDKQVVWKVIRNTKKMHINRHTLFEALRQKYGKESVAIANNSNTPARSEDEVATLIWLYDENGRHLPMPYSDAEVVANCTGNTPTSPGGGFLLHEAHNESGNPTGWCASSYVAVRVSIAGLEPIVENITVEMMDLPLALRTAHATAVWYRAASDRARQQDLEKSKQVKPVF